MTAAVYSSEWDRLLQSALAVSPGGFVRLFLIVAKHPPSHSESCFPNVLRNVGSADSAPEQAHKEVTGGRTDPISQFQTVQKGYQWVCSC